MIKPIRTEADYSAALEQVGGLQDAEEGTAQADELEVLLTLIEKYEAQQFAIEAPSPLAALRFRMEQQDLKPRDLEPYIGSRARVSEVLSGVRPLSIDMIRALHEHLGIPAEVLIRETEPVHGLQSPKPAKPVLKFLTEYGYLRARESFEQFLDRAFGPVGAAAMLRKTRTERTAKTDTAALQAWCASVILKSRETKHQCSYKPDYISDDFIVQLRSLSLETTGPVKACGLLSDVGVTFVVLPHFPGTHLDGAALLDDGRPIIALTLRHDRTDNFWFTLLHELAHVRYHLSKDRTGIFDDLEVGGVADYEREADELAKDWLIPKDIWSNFPADEYTSIADILELAKRANVDPAIPAGRWQKEQGDYRRFARLLGRGQVRDLFRLER